MITAKKALGQNFLKSQKIIDAMIEAGEIDSHDIIVEAGPGKGVLTTSLLTCARQVIAVEKDSRLVLYLTLKFKREITSGKLKLITGDILEFDPAREDLQPGGYKVIANIPYYITGNFLRHFLSEVAPPSAMVLMLQREVAKRIIEADKKASILSLSVHAYGQPKYIETVPAEYFSPKPSVDSAVLLIDSISKEFFKNVPEEIFFNVVKNGFAQKRKKLSSNLTALLPKERVVEIFAKLQIPDSIRAEDVPLLKWEALATEVSKYYNRTATSAG